MISEQLVLDVRIREKQTFNNYFSDVNAACVSTLIRLIEENSGGLVYLWGRPGVGKTHLMQACCENLARSDLQSFYIDFDKAHELSPDILDNLESYSLLCIDNIQKISGNPEWERAIFNFYNITLSSNRLLIFSADQVPQSIGIALPDLVSRLAAGIIFHLQALSDEQKEAVLRLRAHEKGLIFSDQVVHFIMTHYSRNLGKLLILLDRLDQFSLDKKRAITISLLKELL